MTAKQNRQVIEYLDPKAAQESVPSFAPTRDWHREVGSIMQAAAKLKGEGSPIAMEAFNICRKSAELVEAATTEADKLDQIRTHSRSITKALRRLEKVLDRAE